MDEADLPAEYELTDATADLGELAVADVAAAQDEAQAIVDGAVNAAELTLDASYTLEDSAANLVDADAAVLNAASSVSVTDDTVTLEQYNALQSVVAELPPIGETAVNASGKIFEGDLLVSELNDTNAFNFSGLEGNSVTLTVDESLELDENANLGGIEIVVEAGQQLWLSAAQVHGLTQAGGSITGEGSVYIDIDGNDNYDLTSVSAETFVYASNTPAETTLREGVELGDATLLVNDFIGLDGDPISVGGLKLSDEQASGRTIEVADDEEDGNVTVVLSNDGTYDFTGINVAEGSASTLSATVSGNVTLGAGTDLGDLALNVPAGASLTMDVADVNGREVEGSGTLVLTGSQSNADFEDFATSINLDLSGMGGSIDKLPGGEAGPHIADDATLTLNGNLASGLKITGETDTGTISTLAFEGAANQVLSGGTTLTTLAIRIDEGVTLSADAGVINGLTVSGEGALVATGNTDGVDFSNVETSLDLRAYNGAIVDGEGVPNGFDVPGTIAEGNTLTLTAAQAADQAVVGAGSKLVTGLGADAVDLSGFEVADAEFLGGTLIARVTGSPTLDGATKLGDFEVQLPSGNQILTLGAGEASGATITGAGNVRVVAAATETDLSKIDVAGTVTLRVTSNTDLSSVLDIDLGAKGTIQVLADKQLTLSAEQATEFTVNGAGNVVVKLGDDAEAIDLSNISLTGNGELTVMVTDALDVTGVDLSSADNIDFGDNEVDLTLNAAQLSGKIVTGSVGDLLIANSGTLVDETDIADAVGLELANNVELTASTAVLDKLAVTATDATEGNAEGTLTVTGAATDGLLSGIATSFDITAVTGTATEVQTALGTLSLAAGNTLTMTAAQAAGLDTATSPTWDSTAGTIAIEGDASGLDFSNIGASLDLRGATVNADTQLPNDGSETEDVDLATDQTLHLNAADADGLSSHADEAAAIEPEVSNKSTIKLYGDAKGLDLSGITSGLDLTDATFDATTILPGADPAAEPVDEPALVAHQQLTLTAAQADQLTLVADATDSAVVIEDLQDTLGADFTGITGAGTKEATFDGTGTFAGELSGVTVKVADEGQMTIAASTAAGQTFVRDGDNDGTGVVKITGSVTDSSTPANVRDFTVGTGEITANLDLSELTGDAADVVAALNGTASLPDMTAIALVAGQVLTMQAAHANAATISGTVAGGEATGVVLVGTFAAAPDADIDLSSIAVNLDITGAELTVSGGYIAWPGAIAPETSGDGILADGQTLKALASQVSGETLSVTLAGDAELILSGNAGGQILDLTSVTNLNIDVRDANVTVVQYASGEIVLDQTVKMNAAQADQLAVANAGTIEVHDLDQTLDADLSNISTDGTVDAFFNSTGTFAGELRDTDGNAVVDAITVADDAVLTISAEQASNIAIGSAAYAEATAGNAAGSVVITDLGEDEVILTDVSAYDGETAGDTREAGSVTTTVDADLTLAATTNLGSDLAITLANGAELTLTDETMQVDGRVIEGEGSVVLSDDVTLNNQDLTNIAVDLDISGVGTHTSIRTQDLPGYDAETEIAYLDGQTLTLTAAQAADLKIEGTGNVVVKALGTAEVDLSGINVDGSMTVEVPETAELATSPTTATDLGNFDVTVAQDAVLILTATQAHEVSISGEGSVEVTGTAANRDLSAIETDIKIISSDAARATFPTLTAEQTVTGTAAVLTGASIAGAGTVAVTALDAGTADADLSGLTADSVTAKFDGNATFTGNLGNAVVTVTNGNTLTAAASVVDGATIEGKGTVAITGYMGETVDLSGITTEGNNTITVTDFDGSLSADADLGNFELVIDGDSIVEVPVELADGRDVTVNGNAKAILTGDATGADLSGLVDNAATTIDITQLTGDIAELPSNWATGTLILTAAQASGREINVANGATLQIVDMHLTPDADLTNITGAGTIEAAFDLTQYDNANEVNFSGSLSSDVEMQVGFGATVFVDGDFINGATITGTGTVAAVTGTVNDGDFTNVEANLDLGGVQLTGLTLLPGFGELFNNQVVTIQADQVNGQTVTAAAPDTGDDVIGTIKPVGTLADANFLAIDASLDLTEVELTGATRLPGRVDQTTVAVLDANQVLTLNSANAALIGGKTVTGGTVAIEGDATGLDLRKIASDLDLSGAELGNARLPGANTTSGLSAELDGQTLTLDANDIAGKVIHEEGAGELEVAGELDGALNLTSANLDVTTISFRDDIATLADGASLTVNDANIDDVSVRGEGSIEVVSTEVAGEYSITLGDAVQANIQFADVVDDNGDDVADSVWSITGFNQDDVMDFGLIADSDENGLTSSTFQQYVKGAAIDAGFLAIATDLVDDATLVGDADTGLQAFFAQSGTAGLGRAINQDLEEGSQMIFALSDGIGAAADTQLWYWDDTADNDGVVDSGELVNIGTLENYSAVDLAGLTANNVDLVA